MSPRPTLRCPCGGSTLERAFEYDRAPRGETQFDFGGQPYRRRYDRCRICEHWFAAHALDLSTLYSSDYVAATYGGAEGMRRRFDKIMTLPADQSDNRQRVARILRFAAEHQVCVAGRAPRALDVGAGLGVFPAALSQAGWQVVALEPDVRTVAHLREVVGVSAEATDLLEVEPAKLGTFELITFNKVLEHVEDPVALLLKAAQLVSSTGFVYVELPDVAAASDGPEREEFFIEHHHVFSPASLVLLAERAGLAASAVERVREPSGKYTLRGFLLPRVGGMRPNE
jgi:SAM-dependent methyltransferase